MKGKKKEEVDFATLPKANMIAASLILDFKNPNKKFKILEAFYKNGTSDNSSVHFITREHIIEYAKGAGIYIDPTDTKKPAKDKDAVPVEKKEITPEELAKDTVMLINDKSVNIRWDKKVILDKIEEAKAQLEESEKYWAAQGSPIPTSNENEKDTKKKKPEPKDNKKKNDKVPPKPEEITIPPFIDDNIEMLVVFYNYPINEEEYIALNTYKNETDDKVSLQLISLLVDIDEYTPPKVEVVLDKKGNPVKPKEVKVSNDVLAMQKYFATPSILSTPQPNTGTDNTTNESPAEMSMSDIYDRLKETRNNSEKGTSMRSTTFERADFTCVDENALDGIVDEYYKKYVEKMAMLNSMYVAYNKFSKDNPVIAIDSEDSHQYNTMEVVDINKGVQYQHDSIGRALIAYCDEQIKKNRLDKKNRLFYELNDFDEMFDEAIKKYSYEYHVPNSSNNQNNNNESNDNIIGEPLSHIIIANEKEIDEVDHAMNKSDINSTPFKLIINYKDEIYKNVLEEKISNKYISLNEKNLNIFFTLPEIEKCIVDYYNDQRHFNRKKGKNNEIYHYVLNKGIKRAMYDKIALMRKFERMIMNKVPEQKINFNNRIYEENFDNDLFKQELKRMMMFDYEISAIFDERTNKTLLAFYYRYPKGRVYRRRKEYKYLSKPDFDNWIKFFAPKFKMVNNNSDEVIDSKDKSKKNVESVKIGFKFVIDEEAKDTTKPETTLYDADDIKVGNVNERLKYMFPSDNGVIVKKVVETGIFSTAVSYIRKDDIIFGIKQSDDSTNEFWLNFDDALKMTVQYKDDYDPFFKNIEDPVESPNGSIITFTLPSGLLVQILPNGEIIQKKFSNDESSANMVNANGTNFDNNFGLNANVEHYRVIASKGSVVKYFALETKILYSNGNACSIINNLATNVNNKGLRIARSVIDDSEVSERESIPISSHFDPESNTKTVVREDNVIVIDYPDTSKYVIHSDDTRIYTSPTVKEITKYIVEHDDYATVEITYDQVKKRTMTCIASGSTEALMGADNLMTRSYDGRLSKIIFPDGTTVFTYKEKKATEEFETYSFNTVTIVHRIDGTVVRISQDGDIVVITANERKKLNEKGMNKDFENLKDTDYLFELNGKSDERKGGVYTCDMKKGKIWTRDNETNIFELHSNGDAKCKVQGTTIKEMNEKTIDEIVPDSPRYTTYDYINPETRFSDAPSNFFPPRLFLIDNSDYSATEFLCEEQIDGFKRMMRKQNAKYTTSKSIVDESTVHMWIKEQKEFNELLKDTQMVSSSIRLPQKYQKISQSQINPLYSQKKVFIVRKIKETPSMDESIRSEIESAEKECEDTYNTIHTKKNIDVIDKNIIKMNKDIQRRFIMERLNKGKIDSLNK